MKLTRWSTIRQIDAETRFGGRLGGHTLIDRMCRKATPVHPHSDFTNEVLDNVELLVRHAELSQ